MNKYYNTAFLVIAFLLAAGCARPAQEQALPATTATLPTSATPTAPAPAAPTAVQTSMETLVSDSKYQSPSTTFSMQLPRDWNCSETGNFQTNCEQPQGNAALLVRVTATGYPLDAEAFSAFTHGEMVSQYADVKEYREVDRKEEIGLISLLSTWREDQTYIQGRDLFLQSQTMVLHVHMRSDQDAWEGNQQLFDAVAESIETYPAAVGETPLYVFKNDYTAPDLFFELEVPSAWTRFVDVASVEKTVVEGFLSPDLSASVQVAVYRQGSTISRDIKADKTLEIMRKLYGWDLRVSHDKALPDGRERLEWYATRRGIKGVSYFDSYATSLYIFSVLWDEPLEDIYYETLDEIINSFSRG